MEIKIISRYSRIGALIGGIIAGILILISASGLITNLEIGKFVSTLLLMLGFPLSYFLFSPMKYIASNSSSQIQDLTWVAYNVIPVMINGFFLGFILKSEKLYVANHVNVSLMSRLYRKLFQGFFFLAYTFLIMGVLSFVILLSLANSSIDLEKAQNINKLSAVFVPIVAFVLVVLIAYFRKLPGVNWKRK